MHFWKYYGCNYKTNTTRLILIITLRLTIELQIISTLELTLSIHPQLHVYWSLETPRVWNRALRLSLVPFSCISIGRAARNTCCDCRPFAIAVPPAGHLSVCCSFVFVVHRCCVCAGWCPTPPGGGGGSAAHTVNLNILVITLIIHLELQLEYT